MPCSSCQSLGPAPRREGTHKAGEENNNRGSTDRDVTPRVGADRNVRRGGGGGVVCHFIIDTDSLFGGAGLTVTGALPPP